MDMHDGEATKWISPPKTDSNRDSFLTKFGIKYDVAFALHSSTVSAGAGD
jgi:hypothetical protein